MTESESNSTYNPPLLEATGQEILAELKKITPGGGAFVVNITISEDGQGNVNYTSDKTALEIYNASVSGAQVVAKLHTNIDSELLLNLYYCSYDELSNQSDAQFSALDVYEEYCDVHKVYILTNRLTNRDFITHTEYSEYQFETKLPD